MCVWGGFRLRGLCPCCKIHRGDYVHVVKFMGGGGGLCPCCKINGGGSCPRIQIVAGGGGVVRGDIVLH